MSIRNSKARHRFANQLAQKYSDHTSMEMILESVSERRVIRKSTMYKSWYSNLKRLEHDGQGEALVKAVVSNSEYPELIQSGQAYERFLAHQKTIRSRRKKFISTIGGYLEHIQLPEFFDNYLQLLLRSDQNEPLELNIKSNFLFDNRLLVSLVWAPWILFLLINLLTRRLVIPLSVAVGMLIAMGGAWYISWHYTPPALLHWPNWLNYCGRVLIYTVTGLLASGSVAILIYVKGYALIGNTLNPTQVVWVESILGLLAFGAAGVVGGFVVAVLSIIMTKRET